MKFLAFLNGELSNAATYFSSFATVSKADSCLLGKEFGTAPTCKWRPWSYAERVNVAEKVAKFHRRTRRGWGATALPKILEKHGNSDKH
jgi:hypothetical protein